MDRNRSSAGSEESARRDARAGRAALAGWLVILSVITAVAYSPGMRGGFYFDDRPNIVGHAPLHWREVSWVGVVDVVRNARSDRRPLSNLSFALNHRFSGLDPAPYHWTNLAIHVLAGWALAWLLVVYLRTSGRSGRWTFALAGVGAGIFLLHPLATQAVTYVVQRMASLATLFMIAALACYLEGRNSKGRSRRHWFGLGLGVWLFALLSKENAITLGLVVGLQESIVYTDEWKARLEEAWKKHRMLVVASGIVFFALASAGVMAAFRLPYVGLYETFEIRDYSGLERVMTQGRVHLLYLSLLVWPAPSRLSLDHELPVSRGLFDPWTTVVCLGLVVAVIAASLWRAQRRPRIAVWVLAYFALHSLESGPINLEMVFEHRMYAPMVPAVLLLIELVAILEPIPRKRAIGLLVALLVPMALATFSRNRTWGDPMAFQSDRAAKSPNSTRALYDYGTTLGTAGRLQEAEQVLSRLLELDPGSSAAHNQLGNVYLLMGRRGPAFVEYQRAVELGSDNPEALYNLGHRFLEKRDFGRAAELFERFLEVAPAGFERQEREINALLPMLEGR